MKKIRRLYSKINDNRGVTATIVVILMTVFLGFTALVIDLGYAYITKNELQNIADASALAATRQLGEIYLNLTNSDQQNYVCSGEDTTLIKKAAQDVALANIAAGKKIEILSDDIKIGTWNNKENPPFIETNDQPYAVEVTARRDQIANNPITTFFANILGHNTLGLTADSTAALSGQSTIEEGELIPIGISKQWFSFDSCNKNIQLHPSNSEDSCLGWNTYFNKPSSDSKLRKDILDKWLAGEFTPPGAKVGDEFWYTGGDLSTLTFDSFNSLFEYMRFNDGDGDDDVWTASVVVYEPKNSDKPCANPNQNLTIAGFATIVIKGVEEIFDDKEKKSKKTIQSTIVCDLVAPGRGGGNDFKTFGSIPGLVE